MPESISRSTINALLPPGAIWIPAPGDDLDLLLDGIADSVETVRVDADNVAFTRNAQKTTILDDLELEFGVPLDPTLSEAERRAQLLEAKNATQGDGTDTFIQATLQQAGFDVQVHQNEPAVDPDVLLDATFSIYCDGDGAFCGHQDAFCGSSSGALIANGDEPINQMSVPVSSDYWHLIFFVGGDATRNATTGALESIAPALVPISRYDELIRLIVKYKPLHTCCGLIVQLT